MNKYINSVWNGLINWGYGFIVCKLDRIPDTNRYHWLAVYDVKKRVNQLIGYDKPHNFEFYKVHSPFLCRDLGDFVIIWFSSDEIEEDYVQEPWPEISDKKELFFDSLEETIAYLRENEYDLEKFMPPHRLEFPLNHVGWEEQEDNEDC